MSELRFDPLVGDWVMIAANRQARPQMPKDWCPFCPGSGKVPEDYDVLMYPNDFPALSKDAVAAEETGSELLKSAPAYGKCEVILYSPDHHATLGDLSVAHIGKLVHLWRDRFVEISRDEKIKYVMIFENRGKEVGVTMPHPHGQIYGYSWVPKKLALESASFADYAAAHGGRCLMCDMLAAEAADGRRLLFENEHFMVFLPYFTQYPYGIYIGAKMHKQNLAQMDESELSSLAAILKRAVGMLDSLYGFPFPYMMCMHQNPVNCGKEKDFHFHIEFFPPLRSEKVMKYNASSETGAWAHCNPTSPEEKAAELRAADARFLGGQHAE